MGRSLPDLGDVSCPQDAQEFSDVERAIETLIKNFHQYSVEGGKETLTPSELRDLVAQQLPHLMPVLRGVTCPRQDRLPKQALRGPTHGATTPGTSEPSPFPLASASQAAPASCPWAGRAGRWGQRGRLAELCLLSPQSDCGLEERIAGLGSCEDSKLEFGSFWELIGEAAKSVKLESPAVRGS